MEANTDPDTDPDPIRIQGFNDQKSRKKMTAEKKIKFFFSAVIFFQFLVIKALDPDWIRIRIRIRIGLHPDPLDPDP